MNWRSRYSTEPEEPQKKYEKVVTWDKEEWSDGHILIVTGICMIPVIGWLFWLCLLILSLQTRHINYEEK